MRAGPPIPPATPGHGRAGAPEEVAAGAREHVVAVAVEERDGFAQPRHRIAPPVLDHRLRDETPPDVPEPGSAPERRVAEPGVLGGGTSVAPSTGGHGVGELDAAARDRVLEDRDGGPLLSRQRTAVSVEGVHERSEAAPRGRHDARHLPDGVTSLIELAPGPGAVVLGERAERQAVAEDAHGDLRVALDEREHLVGERFHARSIPVDPGNRHVHGHRGRDQEPEAVAPPGRLGSSGVDACFVELEAKEADDAQPVLVLRCDVEQTERFGECL